jgi:hypothetical protein
MKKLTFLIILLLAVSLTTGVVMAAPPGQNAGGEAYVVQAGDWLSKIAEKYYGDPLAYPTIVEATNAKAAEDESFAVIEDPDVIEVGQKLWILAADQPLSYVVLETSITEIPLVEPLSIRDAEISGLTWYGDYLIILPQYPNFFTESAEGFVFAIPKADLLAFLDGASSNALEPIQIPFVAPGLQDEIAGFEGYEAIAFVGDKAYITIEAETDAGMTGYLVSGTIAPDLSALTVDTTTRTEIQPQSTVGNMCEESLLVAGETLVTFYEANGVGVNAAPVAHLFDSALAPAGTIPLANIEYRITDVTALDSNNLFWTINYFYPGDEDLLPETDPLVQAYGEGYTHSQNDGVERLIELQYSESGVTLTDTAPIQIALLEDGLRNWEGIVRLDSRGFIVATDKFPQTILAFVPAN